MIKFIYQVEANEEAVNPIGFSFWNTVSNTMCYFGGECIWYSVYDFTKDFVEYSQPLERFTDLIPKDWDKVKFKQA